MGKIVEQYSGTANRWPQNVDVDPEHLRLIHIDDKGNKTVLFTGEGFSEEKFLEDCNRNQPNATHEPPILPDN